MAIAEEIVTQMRRVLPVISKNFTENMECTTAWADKENKKQRITTSHSMPPLNVGDIISIYGFTNDIPITAIAVNNGKVVFESASDNDITYRVGKNNNFIPTVSLTINNKTRRYPMSESFDSQSFEVFVAESDNITVGTTGKLHEDFSLGWNGTFKVSEIENSKNIIVINDNSHLSIASGTGELRTGIRIHRSFDIERTMEAYTEKQLEKNTRNLWLYVVADDDTISRDIRTENDSNYDATSSGYFKLDEINRFSVYLFIPTKFEATGAGAKDIAKALKPYIYKSIIGYKPKSAYAYDRTEPIIPVSNDTYSYNPAFYIHEYKFEYKDFITNEGLSKIFGIGDLLPQWQTVALRRIDFDDRNELGEIVRENYVKLPK